MEDSYSKGPMGATGRVEFGDFLLTINDTPVEQIVRTVDMLCALMEVQMRSSIWNFVSEHTSASVLVESLAASQPSCDPVADSEKIEWSDMQTDGPDRVDARKEEWKGGRDQGKRRLGEGEGEEEEEKKEKEKEKEEEEEEEEKKKEKRGGGRGGTRVNAA
eukprot:753738-Hanusia_phi.AAC.1